MLYKFFVENLATLFVEDVSTSRVLICSRNYMCV